MLALRWIFSKGGFCNCEGGPEDAHAVVGEGPRTEGSSLLLCHRRRWHRKAEWRQGSERIPDGPRRHRCRLLACRPAAKEQLDPGAGLSAMGGDLVDLETVLPCHQIKINPLYDPPIIMWREHMYFRMLHMQKVYWHPLTPLFKYMYIYTYISMYIYIFIYIY